MSNKTCPECGRHRCGCAVDEFRSPQPRYEAKTYLVDSALAAQIEKDRKADPQAAARTLAIVRKIVAGMKMKPEERKPTDHIELIAATLGTVQNIDSAGRPVGPTEETDLC